MSKKDLDVLVAKAKNIPDLKFDDIQYMGVRITDMTKEQLMACLAHSIGLNIAKLDKQTLSKVHQAIKTRQEGQASRRVVDVKDGTVYAENEAPDPTRTIAVFDVEYINRSTWLRNEKCPCGSGKKFKHCCLGKDKAP